MLARSFYAHNAEWQRPKWLVAILFALLLVGAFGCSAEGSNPQVEPTYRSSRKALAAGTLTSARTFCVDSLNACIQSGFVAYVNSRVVEVIPTGRAPLVLGPWEAEEDYHATDASSDGSLTTWADDYYITHDWSEIGQEILSIEPGDTVLVNGTTVLIEDTFNYPKDSYYDEIQELVGADAVVFQTCYPDSDYNRIAWGVRR